MKKLYSVLCLTLCCLLCGCTTEADRIYTVCAVKDDNTYCYNQSGFYVYDPVNDVFTGIEGYGLIKKPALQLFDTDSADYSFTYVLPGLYTGTLESISNYVHYLRDEYGAQPTVSNADCNSLEIMCESETVSTRILFNIRGEVRIYTIDENGEPTEPVGIERKESKT